MSEAPPSRINGQALTGFLFALTAPVFQALTAVPALILGFRGLRAANESDGELGGRRLAIVAVVLGAGVILLDILALTWLIVLTAREASNRAECVNHLHQLSLAVNLYQNSYKVYPSGTIRNPDLLPPRRLSWVVAALPFTDQKHGAEKRFTAIYEKLDPTRAWNDKPNEEVASLNMPFCLCRSHASYDPLRDPGRTDYVGLAGRGREAAQWPASDDRVGVFGYDRQLRPDDVKAGLEHTLLMAETGRDNGLWIAGGTGTVRGVDTSEEEYIGADRAFGGFHPGGMNTAFLDGSVQFLNSNIDPVLFRELVRIRRTP